MVFPGLSAAPLLMGGKSRKTYADFLAHIATLRDIEVNSDVSYAGSGEIQVNVISDGSTAMYGSSWGTYYTPDSIFNRVIRHGLPSEADWTRIVSNSRACLLNVAGGGSRPSFTALDRNGYVSLGAIGGNSRICQKILYWNDLLDGAYQINPFAMGSASKYEF